MTGITGYDTETNIRYRVSNDSTHLYLAFDTDSRGVLVNILRSGVKIHIDTAGKKKGTACLHYPRIERPEPGTRRSRDMRGQGERGAFQRNLNERLMGMSDALWVWGEYETFIDLQLDNSDFDGLMRMDTSGFLQYFVAIPLHSIKSEEIHEIAMGIEIEAPSSPPAGMYGGGSRQMDMGGGPPPGGGGIYGRPEGQRPGIPQFDTDPVRIWFKVQMAKVGD